MTHSNPHESREAQALAEIATTRISRAGSWTLTLTLLAALAVGSLIEAARAGRGEATAFAGGVPIPTPQAFFETFRRDGALTANRELHAGLLALEDRLGRESGVSAALRPAAQTALSRGLGYGNSQVLVGRQGALYFRTEFDYLTGRGFLAPGELARRRTFGARYFAPHPNPVPGLVRLSHDLAAQGIELVFFPVPVKAQVHPEGLIRFGARSADAALPPANPSYPELVRRLTSAGIPVYDALPDLRAAALAGEVLYRATDTHWNARGMRIAADGLARFLARATALPPRPPAGFRRRSFAHELEGDLTRLLGAGVGGPIYPGERLELDEIVALGDTPFDATAAADADVLLLGDSYARVYTFEVGGKSGGFTEQLAFALDRPVQRSAKLGANLLSDRVQWLREDPQLLAGKRVVVYEVTARALSSADWSAAPLRPKRHQRRQP